MGWSEPGFGFFGKGYWARRVLWDNVPVQQRTLDVYGHLEGLLEGVGGELEAFLAHISLLPQQRDPYLARGSVGESEWMYVTQAMRWTDEARGAVMRLIEEADSERMPAVGHVWLTFELAGYVVAGPADVGRTVRGLLTGDMGTLVHYDNTTRAWLVSRVEAADRFDAAEIVVVEGSAARGRTLGAAPDLSPWFPYEPVSNAARWWTVQIPAVDDAAGAISLVSYEVALPRTRNYDPPALYDASRSLGNEMWVQGGDLVLPFQHPAGWLLTGDAVADAAAYGVGTPVGLGDGSATPPLVLPGPQQRLNYNQTAQPGYPATVPWTTVGARVMLDVPLQSGGTLRLYDMPYLTNGPAYDNADFGLLLRENPGLPGTLDEANPLGVVSYASGAVRLNLAGLGLLSLFDGTVRAWWEARGCYVEFQPPRVLDHLARDYGFENDRNDPEDRQRAAIAHLFQYYGCKGASDAYRIRGEISLFTVEAQALWRLCTAALAAALPPDRVYLYDGTFYTDLAPRHLRMDDIRADEQYYDTFNHETPVPAPPEWLSLADRALMYEDDAYNDGMSVGLAFALDVTQGYYGLVSETDPAARTPATVLASTALTPAEAAAMLLAAGWRVQVQMMRCQAEAFNFTKGHFGLTEYDKAGLVPPAIDDAVFWIDAEDTPWTLTAAVPGFPGQDVGVWTVIIGVGVDDAGMPLPGPTVGEDVAVRYWPEVDKGDCCFCRSYKMRVVIEPMPQAYDYYTDDGAMLAAVDRIKDKILGQLIPIHARVAEWAVTTEWSIFMGGVQTGFTDARLLTAGEFLDLGPSGRVLVSIEQRGDLALPARTQTMRLLTGAGAPLVPPVNTGAVNTGVADPETWYPVAGFEPATPADITASVSGVDPVRVEAAPSAGVGYGDVRWTFRVTRGTLG